MSAPVVAWGGRAYPRLEIPSDVAPPPASHVYQFSVRDGVPQLEVALKLVPVRQSVSDLLVGQTRLRRDSWRLDVGITFNAPGNSRLIEFLRRASDPTSCPYLKVYPHPGELWTYNFSRDWFRCVLPDDFAPEYYLRKWLGHGGTLNLRGAEELSAWPQSSAPLGFIGTTFVIRSGAAVPDSATGPTHWDERYFGSTTGWESDTDRDVAYWETDAVWNP